MNEEYVNSYKTINNEETIKRGFVICEKNKRALQNRYQLLHTSFVRSASSYSDMPHSASPNVQANESRIISLIQKETDSVANYISLFKEIAKVPDTHNEGIFLYYYYVIGKGKEEIFEKIGIKNDKRKRKSIMDNAYFIVAQACNCLVYNTETVIEFYMDDDETESE